METSRYIKFTFISPCKITLNDFTNTINITILAFLSFSIHCIQNINSVTLVDLFENGPLPYLPLLASIRCVLMVHRHEFSAKALHIYEAAVG